ncbi:MAG: FAD-dependent oxidoreductase [Dehalococcoidales bacterium]|jgi:succinate dehydrogenase/fumarate reductase flavoprotein subunit
MSTWHEYVQQTGKVPEWPYPVNYGKVNEITADVLVIGGGVAGLQAAINAAKTGAKVAVLERGHAKRSGSGGAGVDHWHGAVTNPCSKVTPQMYTDACYDSMLGWTGGHVRYIITKESWDTLLEVEKMGVQIRDIKDEFKGADFRDEETKLMFGYDYKNKHIIRVWAYNIKPKMYAEAKRLDINIQNRLMPTALLTAAGKQGMRVTGATAVNTHTGEFYVFKAKATVIATGGAGRLFVFDPETTASGTMADMNSAGVGQALGWNAGAEFVCMEGSAPGGLIGFGYAPYSMGNASNTYHGTPIVDAEGKELPWVDVFGRELKTWHDRFYPQEGQQFQLGIGIGISRTNREFRLNDIPPNIVDRIRNGEFKLPLYADFTRLSPEERRCIFGMMVGNEGKTRIPIYDTMTKAGFDPDKDLFQAPVMPVEGYFNACYWAGGPNTPSTVRSLSGGGFLTDWNLMTNLEGLYIGAGSTIYGGGCHGESHTTGRYAGKRAAAYARTAAEPTADKQQVEAQREAAYRATRQSKEGNGWKEINAAVARIMRDYCGKHKNEMTLNLGLRLLNELKTTELASAYASNPHELGRLLECHALVSVGELVIKSSLARKASNSVLDFHRIDYPQMDPPEWNKLLPIRQEKDAVKVRELALDFHLKAPYAASYEENYRKHGVK